MSKTTLPTFDIAIIGGGFSGVITLANCLRFSKQPLRIALCCAQNLGRGTAYSTEDIRHLLNVPAHNMSAFPDASNHFVEWLATQPDTNHYKPYDFVPRLFYGDYIDLILNAALQAEGHDITLIEEEVVSIDTKHTLTTATQQSFMARKIVLATGNEAAKDPERAKHISAWELQDYPLPNNAESIVILGAGLTAIDAYLTLRGRGFDGTIIMASRSGRIPNPHPSPLKSIEWIPTSASTLSAILQQIRQRLTSYDGPWQHVMDGMRPHLQRMWHDLPIPERQRFLNRYFGLWNIHRHRMAPQIWEQLKADTKLQLISLRKHPLPQAALTVECIGQTYRTAGLKNPLIQQLLSDGLVKPHETGFGLQAEGYKVGKELYAMGPLLMGELLETTAVPELRSQAADIAKHLVT